MAAPAIGRRPRYVPPQSAKVDWSHPLAPLGGWGALPGYGVDFFGQPGTLTTNASFGSSAYGPALVTSSATTGGIQFPFPAHLKNATKELTLVALTSIDGLNANNNVLLVIRDNATEASPFLTAAMFELSSTTDARHAIRSQAGSYSDVTAATGGFATGLGMQMHAAVLAPPSATAYRNGARLANPATLSSSPSGISYATSPPGIAVSGYGTVTTTQGIQGACALALIYPRALSANELGALYADPFCFMRS